MLCPTHCNSNGKCILSLCHTCFVMRSLSLSLCVCFRERKSLCCRLHQLKICPLFPRQQPCTHFPAHHQQNAVVLLNCFARSLTSCAPCPLPSLFLLLHLPSLSVFCCIPSSKRRAPRHYLTPSHLPFSSLICFLIPYHSVLYLTKSSTVMENTVSGRAQTIYFLMNMESATCKLLWSISRKLCRMIHHRT